MSAYDWQARAACRNDPDAWHPRGTTGQWKHHIATVRRICNAVCPVREKCLQHILRAETGLAANSRWGIAAGLDGDERAALDPTTPVARDRPTSA